MRELGKTTNISKTIRLRCGIMCRRRPLATDRIKKCFTGGRITRTGPPFDKSVNRDQRSKNTGAIRRKGKTGYSQKPGQKEKSAHVFTDSGSSIFHKTVIHERTRVRKGVYISRRKWGLVSYKIAGEAKGGRT